ncbi:DUF3592 domain-containing protein [Parerythrobacter aestuarii]|uniref:DUF3592 domain-containing protein n=1 Tax=Parerythrobacter aestuarii TaxID=3020909 RepID=UPI0024DEB874|nr:DUF3592 domain-containing protein [Parerythrobacter aestuarii]
MPRFMFWIGLVFALVGTGLAYGTFYAWTASQSMVNDGVQTEGKVIDLEYRPSDDGGGTYAPVVEFHDRDGNRQVYYSAASSNPPSHSRGDVVTIYYMPDTPERAMIDSFSDRWMVILITGIMTLAFGGIGYGILFFMVRRWRTVRRLKAHGMAIMADFEGCHLDTSTRVNGRSPWRVVATAIHPGTGKKDAFESEQIWVNLSEELQGKKLRVLVDPARPHDHYVDLSEYIAED